MGASSPLNKTALLPPGATSSLLSETCVTQRAPWSTFVSGACCHQMPIFGRAVSARPVAW
jgi:hypothetical protein